MQATMLIDVPGVLSPAVAGVLTRMRLAGVPVLLFADQAASYDTYDAGAITAVIVPAGFPAPKALLMACREHGVEMATSWLITARMAGLEAASQAGIPQAVFVGSDVPAVRPPIRIELAADLADAPRVMVPKDGGCWHE